MAVIKFLSSKSKIGGILRYVKNIEKTDEKIISGINCNDKMAKEEMTLTKEMHQKTEGRQYYHLIQSFKPGEVEPEKAHEIGKELAENKFENYECVVCTHIDKDHIHNHIIINSVNKETGRMYHSTKQTLREIKLQNDKICERERLSIPELKNDDKIRLYNQKKYQLFKRIEKDQSTKSYVLDTALAVESSIEKSKNKTEFIENMKMQGYETSWKDEHKHVTFQDKEGHKVRLSNLEKTFKEPKFSKEGLVNEFSRSKEQESTRQKQREERSFDRGAVERPLGSKKDRLSECSSNAVIGVIQHKVRAVKDRTDRATESTEARNSRIEENSRKIKEQQRNIKSKHKDRDWQLERGM
jgi:hypothetical protein